MKVKETQLNEAFRDRTFVVSVRRIVTNGDDGGHFFLQTLLKVIQGVVTEAVL